MFTSFLYLFFIKIKNSCFIVWFSPKHLRWEISCDILLLHNQKLLRRNLPILLVSLMREGWSYRQYPPLGYPKVNLDGAHNKHTCMSTDGGIIRNADANGCFVPGFICNLGFCSALMAEMRALLNGTKVASNIALEKVILRLILQCLWFLSQEDQLQTFILNLFRKRFFFVTMIGMCRSNILLESPICVWILWPSVALMILYS